MSSHPKHTNGAIFVRTSVIILGRGNHANVVQHPELPICRSGEISRAQSTRYPEKYADYIALGVEEWRKVYVEHEKLGKKAVLFIMTDDTKNCDDVAAYLVNTYPEFQGAVLTIHTNNNGEISESDNKKSKEELELLRKESNQIDSWESPYKVIVLCFTVYERLGCSNCHTIVGLRAYAPKVIFCPSKRGGGCAHLHRSIPRSMSRVGTVLDGFR